MNMRSILSRPLSKRAECHDKINLFPRYKTCVQRDKTEIPSGIDNSTRHQIYTHLYKPAYIPRDVYQLYTVEMRCLNGQAIKDGPTT